jgi:hypothetical protein
MGDARLQIVIDALNNAKAELSALQTDLKGVKTAEDDGKTSTSSLNGALSELGLGSVATALTVAGLVGLVVGAGKAMYDAAKETVDYNKTVRDLAQDLNSTTEDTSRLIQTADDYGISIGTVEAAMKMALKNGFAPSIDTLADMADKYVELKDPMARAEELTAVFGRNWSELTPMLKDGGQTIRDVAAAQSDSLLVTEDAAQAARDYEKALDGLQDAMQGLEYKIGNKVIPVLTDLTSYLNDQIAINERVGEQIGKGWWDYVPYAAYIKALIEGADVTGKFLDVSTAAKTMSDNITIAHAAEALALVSVGTDTDYVNTATGQYNLATGLAADALRNNMEPALAANQKQLGGINDLFGEVTEKILFNKLAANLDAEAAFTLAEKMGLVDAGALLVRDSVDKLTDRFDLNHDGIINNWEATNDYYLAAADLRLELDKLNDKSVSLTFTINGQSPADFYANYGIGPGWGGGTVDVPGPGVPDVPQGPGFAEGGDFWTNGPQMIMVGEGARRERVTVTPEGQPGAGGGVVINPTFIVQVPLDMEAALVRMVQMIQERS